MRLPGTSAARPTRCRGDRRAVRHRHLQPTRCPLRSARNPQRIGAAAPVQHGHAGRAVRQPAHRRSRRRRHQSVQRRRFDGADRGVLSTVGRCRAENRVDGRRPHDRPADPAGDGQPARPGRAGARRCPHRYQRLDVRRTHRPRHPVPTGSRGGPARLLARRPDRCARHRVSSRRLRLVAPAGLPCRAGRGVLAPQSRAVDGRDPRSARQLDRSTSASTSTVSTRPSPPAPAPRRSAA